MANLLQSRQEKVTIVTEEGEEEIFKEPGVDIEDSIVDRITSKHKKC